MESKILKRMKGLATGSKHLAGGMALALIAGCGGTNPTDGSTPYNRGTSQPGAPIPGDSKNALAAPNELKGSVGLIHAPTDVKEVEPWVARLKRMESVPKRFFVMGLTPEIATKLAPIARDLPFEFLPVPSGSEKLADWNTILGKLNRTKAYSGGPSTEKPNLDGLKESHATRTVAFTFEGERFLVVNTDTEAAENLQVPLRWMIAQLDKAEKEGVKDVFVIGRRAFPKAKEEASPEETTEKHNESVFGDATAKRFGAELIRHGKVRAYVSFEASPLASGSRLEGKGPFVASVGKGSLGFVEFMKNGTVRYRPWAPAAVEGRGWEPGELLVLFQPSSTTPTGVSREKDAKPVEDKKSDEKKVDDKKTVPPDKSAP